MASGLLSLKWNNHRSTFFHVLSTIRSKESYCDVTLACDGRFYSLHKFVLSTCSEYFEEMFERTQCKHPVIVLKDIKYDDLEALLNYMYVGEVNVVQEKLAGLIKAAECLKIKGLAVPDEDPMESKENNSVSREQHKRSQRTEDSPRAKKRRRENSSDISEEIHNPVRSRNNRNRDNQSSHNKLPDEDQFLLENKESNEESENSSINANRQPEATNGRQISHKKEHIPEEVILDEDPVKSEPIDLDNPDNSMIDNPDTKDSLHQELGFDASDSLGAEDDNYVDVDPSLLGEQGQSVEDVVAQAMPGSSGFQANSFPMWEGEGSLSNFPNEGFSGDNSQNRQMVALRPASSSPDEPPTKHQKQRGDGVLKAGGVSIAIRNDLKALPPSSSASSPGNSPRGLACSGSSRFVPSSPNDVKDSGSGCLVGGGSSGISSIDLEALASTIANKNIATGASSHYSPIMMMHRSHCIKCPHCEFLASDAMMMAKHQRDVHPDELTYSCPHCTYQSKWKGNLKGHIQRMHPDLFPRLFDNMF